MKKIKLLSLVASLFSFYGLHNQLYSKAGFNSSNNSFDCDYDDWDSEMDCEDDVLDNNNINFTQLNLGKCAGIAIGVAIFVNHLRLKSANSEQINQDKNDSNLKNNINQFINDQCQNNNSDIKYSHSNSSTVWNWIKDHLFLRDSLQRLSISANRFLKNKKGTSLELALLVDYYLMLKGITKRHIVAFNIGPGKSHVFNIYVDDSNKLHIIDLCKQKNDNLTFATTNNTDSTESEKRFHNFNNWVVSTFDPENDEYNYDKWYVMSTITDSNWERFKFLGFKKWAKFYGRTPEDGGFMIINSSSNQFQLNNENKIKWNKSAPSAFFG